MTRHPYYANRGAEIVLLLLTVFIALADNDSNYRHGLVENCDHREQ